MCSSDLANIEIFINDQYFTKIDRKYNLSLEPEQEFTVPLDFTLNNNQVRTFLKKNAIQMLLGNSIHIKYKGNIRVKAYSVGIRVPVNDEKSFNLRDFR